MNITKNKKILLGGVMSLMLLTTACGIVFARGSRLVNTVADDAHNVNCVWNHYDAVDATYNKHGSKEFWACCSHPGSYSFTSPISNNITDRGQFEGVYFDELTSEDERYVAPLFEGMDVLYSGKEQTLAPESYSPESFEVTKGYVDPVVGDYSKVDITLSTRDAVWFRPALDTDISSYTSIVFYIKSNQEINNFKVFKIGYGNITEEFTLHADTWQRVEFLVSAMPEANRTLKNVGLASWGAKNNLVWSVSTIYGIKSSTPEPVNPFEGMDLLYDCQYNYYVPCEYTPNTWTPTAGLVDSLYGYYCELNIASTSQDFAWFKPAVADDISQYSKIVYYIKSNQALKLELRQTSWAVVSSMQLEADTWTKVEFNVSDLATKTLNNCAFDRYIDEPERPLQNLVFSVTSAYGVK